MYWKSLKIEVFIVDTGSSHTIISPDILEKIDVRYENGDSIYEAYGTGGTAPFYTKIMDKIEIDTVTIEKFEIDVGMLPYNHSGLIGLDLLRGYNFIIDFNLMELYIPNGKEK